MSLGQLFMILIESILIFFENHQILRKKHGISGFFSWLDQYI